jgi:hypothetical protein
MRRVRPLVWFLILGFAALPGRAQDRGQRTKDKGQRTSPEVLSMRCRYADLLWEQKQVKEARQEMELFVADAQEMGEAALGHLIHTHSRLTEVALAEEDEYAEHLNRGIGLSLLARRRAGLPEPDGELSCESLLCKAAGELAVARRLRPREARPCWYLYRVWARLGQRQPARRWLNAAGEHAPFSALTPSERRGLELALRLDGAPLTAAFPK